MADVPSLLFCVGRKYYKLHEALIEYTNHGVSKRIPLKSVPEGLVKGLSKVFVAHPDAIVKVTAEGMTLAHLAYQLLEAGYLSEQDWDQLVDLEKPYWTGEELQPNDFVPDGMLKIAVALSRVPDGERREIVKEYGVEFCQGIFGYTYFSGVQFILPAGVEQVSEDMRDVQDLVDAGLVEPVHIQYINDDGSEETDDEEDYE